MDKETIYFEKKMYLFSLKRYWFVKNGDRLYSQIYLFDGKYITILYASFNQYNKLNFMFVVFNEEQST